MDDQQLWPFPNHDPELEPHFLIILTPPFSGSTALAALMDSSPIVTRLERRGEGQWLVPGLCSDRWNPDKYVDYASVRAVWLNEFQRQLRENPSIEFVVEKSPPNMVRIDRIAALFRKVTLLANSRDPYAYCASSLYRRFPAKTLDASRRVQVLQEVASDWVVKAAIIRAAVERHGARLVNYEKLCESPGSLLHRIELPQKVLDSIDVEAELAIKDYPRQKLRNQNARQIALLDHVEKDAVSAVLEKNRALCEFFGY